MTSWDRGSSVIGAALALFVAGAHAQQTPGSTVYRCPGPPVLYTDSLSAQEAKARGCRTIEGAPITIVQTPKPRPPAPPATPAARSGDARVDGNEQRERDSERARILADELRREEQRLAELRKEYNGGEPERQGNERNYQRYLDRVAEMKSSIERRESDIEAIKREIAKLPK